MIILDDMNDCTGCRACQFVCPKDAISMNANSQGFHYPEIDPEKCIECGLCRKRCPHNNDFFNLAIEAKGAQITDEAIRRASASGGVFWSLVREVIRRRGLVFGVKYDEHWNPVFDCSDSESGCEPFRLSKYAEADFKGVIPQLKAKLDQERLIMFVGTPCQVAGVRSALNKDYENLLLVDLVCNSIPSSLVWREFVKTVERKYGAIKSINQRDKNTSWEFSSYSVNAGDYYYYYYRSDGRGNRLLGSYLSLFGGKLSTRLSCFNCKYRSCYKRVGDITIGDFWHINEIYPEKNDHKGLSVVLVNSSKGMDFFNCLSDLSTFNVNVSDLEKYKVLPIKKIPKPRRYEAFWHVFNSRGYTTAAKRFTAYGFWLYFRSRVLKPLLKPLLRK